MDITKIADAYVDVGARTAKFEGKLARVRGRLKKLGDSFARLAKRAAIAFTAMAVAATYAFTKMLGQSISFEEQLARVSTMLTSNVGPQMDKFKTQIAEMAMAYGDSTKALTDGLYDILSAQIAAGEASNVLAVGARAAVAGFTDTSTTISTLLTVLKSFKMDSSKASEVADKLFMVVAQGRTEFAKIAPVLGRATGMAGAAGLTFDELAATLATATRNGILVEQAITGLMAVSRTFLKPQKDAAEAAERAGFTLNKQWLATHSLREAIEKITKSREVSIEQVFAESEAMNVAISVANDLAGYTKDLGLITSKSAGRMETDFKKASKTMAFQLRRLKQGFLEVGKAITEGFMQKMKPLIEEVNNKMPQIIKAFKKVGAAIAEVTAPLLDELIKKLQELNADDIQAFVDTAGRSLISFGQILLHIVKIVKQFTGGFKMLAIIGRHLTMKRYNRELNNLNDQLIKATKTNKALVPGIQAEIKAIRALQKETLYWTNASIKSGETWAEFEKMLKKSEETMNRLKETFKRGRKEPEEVNEEEKITKLILDEIGNRHKKIDEIDKWYAGEMEKINKKRAEDNRKLYADTTEAAIEATEDISDVKEKEAEEDRKREEKRGVMFMSIAEEWKKAMEAATKAREEKPLKIPEVGAALPAIEALTGVGVGKALDDIYDIDKEGTDFLKNINKKLSEPLEVKLPEAQMSGG